MLPNNGFFLFPFHAALVLSLVRIIGTVQLYNTFFYTCHIITGTVKCIEVVYYA